MIAAWLDFVHYFVTHPLVFVGLVFQSVGAVAIGLYVFIYFSEDKKP